MRSHLQLACLVGIGILTPLLSSADSPPPWGGLQPGPHRVGFRLMEERDPQRDLRPIRIYLWYPAARSETGQPMPFGRYAALVDEDFWPMPVSGLLPDDFTTSPLSRGYSAERLSQALATPTGAVEAAPFARGGYPLLAFAQGLYYESPIAHTTLCEYLASRGYVVATCPLIGTQSRMVTLTARDLETQVRDIEFVITEARELPLVDPGKLGLIGFDFGAMSALILTMRNQSVDAFASLDGGILWAHPSGLPVVSPDYDIDRLRIPWLHATRAAAMSPPEGNPEIPSLFETATYANRYLILVEGVGHVDFTSFALIDGRIPLPAYWNTQADYAAAGYRAVCRALSRFFDGYLKGDPEGIAYLLREPAVLAPSLPLTIEHRPAESAPPTYEDLIDTVLSEGIAGGIDLAWQAASDHPDCALVQEATLNQIAYRFLYFWGQTENAMRIFELNVELHPDATEAKAMLRRLEAEIER